METGTVTVVSKPGASVQRAGAAGSRSKRRCMELWERSAIDLAHSIAGGELSAVEVVGAHIRRIEQVDPQVNAVVVERFEAARAEARDVDRRRAGGEALGPLAGVPMTVKECLDVTGLPSTFGLQSNATNIAEQDDPYVARLRRAGAVVLGKTNLSQLMLYIESDNPVYGRTNNPWNLARTPGGSSGGEAAAISAGYAPIGFGTDIGGSIRAPSTFCGIFGLKTTTGRLPDSTRLSIFRGQQAIPSASGPFARNVADLGLALEIANGGLNPETWPPWPLGDPRSVDVRSLRIGFYERLGSFAPAPAMARAAREAAEAFEKLGARVVPFEPPLPDQARDLFFGILSADGARGVVEVLGKNARDPRIGDLLTAVTKPRSQLGVIERLLSLAGERSVIDIVRNYGYRDTHHYWKLVEALDVYRTLFAATMDAVEGGPLDLVVCPPCGLPALLHGKSREVVTAGMYAPLYNVLGYPTGVMPFTRVRAEEEVGRKRSRDRVERGAYETELGSAGLPVGVQIVARPWREHVALAAMSALEPIARERADFPKTPVSPTG
jgi:fatty acid amide hydrolase